MAREHCAQCGFDSELYNWADTASSQRVIPAVLRAAVEGLGESVMGRRPASDTWSIAEYVDHVREMAFGNRFAIEMALEQPGADLGAPPAPSFAAVARTVDVDAALSAVDAEYRALHDLVSSLDENQQQAPVILDGHERTVGWFARHVLHDGLHHMADIGRIRHGFGFGAATETGTLDQINVSNGGVPKTPVNSVKVSGRGLAGDRQNDRRHHGRPVQAICLWSGDVIDELAASGHPIAAGNAGENFTVRGINWSAVLPGSRLDIGDVAMLISAHAIPCAKNAQWFADRDFNRILHSRNPGLSRLYAIPLRAGTVVAGDVVTVEP